MKSAYRNILVAVPPSYREFYHEPADAIRRTTAVLSLVPDVHITFLAVFSVVEELGSGDVNLIPPEVLDAQIKLYEERHRSDIEKYVKWFADNGISHAIMVMHGDPASAILKCAEDCAADLILVGYHHHTSFFDVFTTNVASRVVKNTHCDVMLIASGK